MSLNEKYIANQMNRKRVPKIDLDELNRKAMEERERKAKAKEASKKPVDFKEYARLKREGKDTSHLFQGTEQEEEVKDITQPTIQETVTEIPPKFAQTKRKNQHTDAPMKQGEYVDSAGVKVDKAATPDQ